MKRKTAWLRSATILTGLVCAVAALIFGGPLANGNTDALRLIVSLFAVLAGFIIAIITASSNPKFLYPGNWRIASVHRDEIERALGRYQWLFYIYLVTVTLAFTTTLFKGVGPAWVTHWLERCTFSLAAAALIWSFGLPAVIARVRKRILDQEVENRKKQTPSA